MFIKQRRVRQSRFKSRFAQSSLKRREYIASMYTATVIQGVLLVFLLVAAFRTFVVMRLKFPDLEWYLKFAPPIVMLAVALVVLWAFVGSVRRGIDAYRHPDSPQ